MKINHLILMLFALMACSCSRSGLAEKIEVAHENEGTNANSACVNKNQPSGSICRPNIHRLFSRPEEFIGVKINVIAYAAYGAQGGLLIYPSIESACNRLEYSAIKIAHSENFPFDIEKRLELSGVVRVEVIGRVSENGSLGGIPVIGSVDADFLRSIEAPKTILLKDPRNLNKENFDASFFGEIKQESCK